TGKPWCCVPGAPDSSHAKSSLALMSACTVRTGLDAASREHLVEVVRGILGRHANASASDLLGHDGVSHRKTGDQERGGAATQKRENGEGCECRLECKDHRREYRARGACKER